MATKKRIQSRDDCNVSKLRRMKRVALTVPEVLDFNVEICALREGRIKNDVMIEAIRSYLKNRKIEPDIMPTITYQ